MNLLSDLLAYPGVQAVGEYSFHGDRLSFHHRGELTDEQASLASIMCRANTMALHMQIDILSASCPARCSGMAPARGWVVRGPASTVCVVANVFCFLDNDSPALNQVLAILRRRLAHVPDWLIY